MAYEKEMNTSVSDFLSLHHLGSVLDHLARLGLYIVIVVLVIIVISGESNLT